jgi:hypothetical protein
MHANLVGTAETATAPLAQLSWDSFWTDFLTMIEGGLDVFPWTRVRHRFPDTYELFMDPESVLRSFYMASPERYGHSSLGCFRQMLKASRCWIEPGSKRLRQRLPLNANAPSVVWGLRFTEASAPLAHAVAKRIFGRATQAKPTATLSRRTYGIISQN